MIAILVHYVGLAEFFLNLQQSVEVVDRHYNLPHYEALLHCCTRATTPHLCFCLSGVRLVIVKLRTTLESVGLSDH